MHTYKVNTGHEAALEREVARLKELLIEREDKWDEAKTNMALMTDELEKLRSEKEASSAPCGCQAYRDLEEARGRAEGEAELLQREIATLKDQLAEREDKWDEAQTQLVEERDRSMQYTKEIARLNSELEELSKAYNDEYHETQVYKKAWREQRELVALRDDQIAMLERRLTMKN